MKNDKNYVISLTDGNTGEVSYLYYSDGCGYIFGMPHIYQASFLTKAEADKLYETFVSEKDKNSTTTDGTQYPPDFIHRGLHLNNDNPKGTGLLEVHKIDLITDRRIIVHGEIKHPTGYTY